MPCKKTHWWQCNLQCLQLNFGGGEVVSTWGGVHYLCLKKKGGERGKKTSALRRKMDMHTRVRREATTCPHFVCVWFFMIQVCVSIFCLRDDSIFPLSPPFLWHSLLSAHSLFPTQNFTAHMWHHKCIVLQGVNVKKHIHITMFLYLVVFNKYPCLFLISLD